MTIDLGSLDFEPDGQFVRDGDIWVERDGIQHISRFHGDDAQRYDWIKASIEQYAPARVVLDVGCNIGEIARLLIEDGVVASTDVYGLDIDPTYIDVARERVPGATFFNRALEFAPALGLPPISALVASEVFEHVLDPARAMQALADVLINDGILLITTPDANRWSYNYALAHPHKHRHVFDSTQLTALLENAGLRVLDIMYFKPRADDLVYLMVVARKVTQ